jgi:hypothetical protein
MIKIFSLLDMYLFQNGVFTSTRVESVFVCRHCLLRRSFITSISTLSLRPGHYEFCAPLITNKSKSELSYDRQSVGQSVLVSGHHLGRATNFSFLFPLKLSFDNLKVCYYVVPSLTRGRVCNLQLLLGLASTVFLGSEFCGIHNQILLSSI